MKMEQEDSTDNNILSKKKEFSKNDQYDDGSGSLSREISLSKEHAWRLKKRFKHEKKTRDIPQTQRILTKKEGRSIGKQYKMRKKSLKKKWRKLPTFLRMVSNIHMSAKLFTKIVGLRCVEPYYYIFTVFAKGRWIGKSLLEVMSSEFTMHSKEYYVRSDSKWRNGKLQINLSYLPLINALFSFQI